ncbi:MAG TPA: histidine kinase, partial [Actinomycetota bacterium]|nr:histidine kinase [Actinomycetota bacterium]
MARGKLRVYLGAAPGVGKTYAMLDEGWRRLERGADVVVGVVDDHGRARTLARARGLEVVPPTLHVGAHGGVSVELNTAAVLKREPQVALVDELAHTNAEGCANRKRWEDIDQLLGAGIDVVSTVNIQHIESVNDIVAQILGEAELETV